ncbi:ER membrane protein complex subunit 1 isoform X2 [Condylostylus longicornis]|uniref:ER membrane protein complex subunit 1 isoform X2 n=1 Tax=Condylostylus longicornis TaxID=2530218 RepID=UPI00244DB4CC|nr:ER membrane protein complex subunit 1 isoform X2 [Condylostylus longicornis]
MNYCSCSKIIISLISFLLVLGRIDGLYEDQIKKFDWRKLNIGRVKNVVFDPILSNNRLIVTTEENVLAALSTRTGEIQWRQILENSPRGDVKLFQFVNEESSSNAPVSRQSNIVYDMITITGVAPAIVRGWSAGTGNLEFEWSLMPIQADKAEASAWFYDEYYLYHVMPFWTSHLEITKYFASSGQGNSFKISAPWIQEGKCVLAGSYYVCIEKNQIIYLDLISEQTQVLRKFLTEDIKEVPKVVKGKSGVLIVDGNLVNLNNIENGCEISANSIVPFSFNDQSMLAYTKLNESLLKLLVVNAKSCDRIDELQFSIEYPDYYGPPEILDIFCRKTRDHDKICNAVISTEDGALLFTHQDKIRWVREESITNIVATELIDLPITDSEGLIESEFTSKPGDISGAFVRRITSQVSLLKNAFLSILGIGSVLTPNQKAGLTRDAFGLHKILLILTKSGKIFAMDNLNGKLHWQKYVPSLESFNDREPMKLLVQRTAKQFPHHPICVIVGKQKNSDNGLIFRFNPINGQPIDNGLNELNYKIKQLGLLRDNENVQFVKGLLLLDEYNRIHVIPENTKEMADGMYMFVANTKASILTGYNIQLVKGILKATTIWSVNLGGHGNNHRILTISVKNPIENVHSQGRVLGDRSVLYKYINPNLVAVVTQGLDSIHKYVLNVHLVDVVSGSVVYSLTHKKAREPVHIVHSENWLVYSYYNDKVRRTEITTIELYEGKVQANSTVWSSLDAPPMPLIEKQSYIIPTIVEAMKETITERGITNKDILIGTSSGGIIEMPWALLDPRRPTSQKNREEGSIPYIPELPLPSEQIINYNQTISRIRNIYTSPSGLESTCLVVAYGLDLFVTRVSPSKTFDLLKEDFDYFLISVVLIVLTSSSFFVKYLSARKALKQAWK